MFDEHHLASLCLETIDKCTADALNAEGFTDVDMETLSSVLDRDSLRIKETTLFNAVVRCGVEMTFTFLLFNISCVSDGLRLSVIEKAYNRRLIKSDKCWVTSWARFDFL